ncbi:MAG: phosphatase PAP2 family protein [Rikenellaceae bacterium]
MWDTDLFLLLNFDGGETLDKIMVLISGVKLWIPLYLLILGITWRRSGWRTMLLLLAAIGLAVGLSDIITGVFKNSGLLKGLLPESFPFRLRPGQTPELEGLIHVVKRGGMYGTFSAHAATSLSIGYLATRAIDRRWFSWIMWTQVALVCYSRIYISSHFPQDILLGLITGFIISNLVWRGYNAILPKVAR